MRPHPSLVLALVLAVVVGAAVALVELQRPAPPPLDDPRAALPAVGAAVDHGTFFEVESFASGPEVTQACLRCHEQAAHDFMATSHWTWAGDEVVRAAGGTEAPVDANAGSGATATATTGPPSNAANPNAATTTRQPIGKRNLLNNFCISIESNWPRCTSCHAGYGWKDESFDFADASKIDCLICHDTSGQYQKDPTGAGHAAATVDLLEAARSVGRPTRTNCGSCHFNGGGGNAVKHGDLDATMMFPTAAVDVHMGAHDLQCVDCHRTEAHDIPGRSMAVSVSNTNRVACTDCHSESPHRIDRLNAHTSALACQSCHIPEMARRVATKMEWDWSEAGEDRPDADPHAYNKKKGSFVYERGGTPEYHWYNGTSSRYLKGDPVDADGVTPLNLPHGDASDPSAKIWPFKVHRGEQIYDSEYGHFLVPKTFGEGGYWSDYDWDQAARLGSEASGLPYSGHYGFAKTSMYWPLSHMVAPGTEALQCADCHGDTGRMDWRALGYDGDPAEHGGRERAGLLRRTDRTAGPTADAAGATADAAGPTTTTSTSRPAHQGGAR